MLNPLLNSEVFDDTCHEVERGSESEGDVEQRHQQNLACMVMVSKASVFVRMVHADRGSPCRCSFVCRCLFGSSLGISLGRRSTRYGLLQ